MTWVLAWRAYLVLDEPTDSRTPETTGSVRAAKKFATWDDATQWAIGLWGSDVFNDPRVFAISVDQLDAIRTFRKTHGRRWKYLLLWEWDQGNSVPELRQLRNALGPRWLYRQGLIR